jgi:catechol 2,3-dioxygenase-like lactoylglutathione lyase family enzyme
MTPTIRDLKVYTPARDFEMSKRFYAALGFEMTSGWGGTMDCRLGGAVFRLQNYYVKDWAENFMMLFGVEDAVAWYRHAKAAIDSGEFGSARVSEPEEAGGATLCHVWDPSGVLLIFIS